MCARPSALAPGERTAARNRRGRAAIGLAVAALYAAACASPPSDHLVVGIESAPTSLDPRRALDASSAQVASLLFRGLIRVGPAGEPMADLAERWDQVDPLTYRFFLREARFHDGSRVTAGDVVATLRSLDAPTFRSRHGEWLSHVATIEAEDSRTVRFTLREPFAPFLHGLTMGVVPAACATRSECTVGSGPFLLAGRDRDSISLAAAPTADPSPRLPGVVFRASPDATSRALGLARGAIDLVQNGVEPDLLPWLRAQGLEVLDTPGATFHYLGLNLRLPGLSDARVRRAIAHAIDRQAIVEHLLLGHARAAGELLPPEHWAHAGARPLAYDPPRARALLAEAGALPLRLRYKTSTVEQRRRVAEAIAFFLGEVGIEVEIRPLEWAALYGDVRKGNFELFSLAWVGVVDPDHYFGWLHSEMAPPRGDNRGGYTNAHVDRLAREARDTADPGRRRDLYARLVAEVEADLPYVPLWWTSNVVVVTPRLAGFAPAPDGDLRGLASAWWSRAPRRAGEG